MNYARLHVKFYAKNIAVMTDIIDTCGYDLDEFAKLSPPPRDEVEDEGGADE
jgi:hypothetical protein